MADFKIALTALLVDEGVYANNPHDAGGETVFGISRHFNPMWTGWQRVDELKTQHPNLKDLNDALTVDPYVTQAVSNFYKSVYWNFDPVKSQGVGNRLLAMEVNFGKGQAVKIVQQGLIRLGANIHLDGSLGPSTLLAIENANENDLMHALRAYSALARLHKVISNPDQIVFAEGWLWRDTA
jgi:lysozyme family protein